MIAMVMPVVVVVDDELCLRVLRLTNNDSLHSELELGNPGDSLEKGGMGGHPRHYPQVFEGVFPKGLNAISI